MASAPERWRGLLLALVILPFWTSFLIRVYAWVAILKDEGLLNELLLRLGLIARPLGIYNTETAVLIGIVYSYLPFMILPLYANLEKHDPALIEAAADLGCPPWRAFWVVTLPLALPGIVAGSLLVFIPAVGEFVIPDLLGGTQTLMIGRTLWLEFFQNRDWPTSSAAGGPPAGHARFADSALPAAAGRERRPLMRRGLGAFRASALALGLAFLYAPIVLLVLYSFNASRLVTVWGGFSTAGTSRSSTTGSSWTRPGSRCGWRCSRPRWRSCSGRWPASCWRARACSAGARCSSA